MASLIYFRTDGMRYALNMAWVMQVAWLPALSRTDGAPVWLAGLLNLQGQSVPVIDFGRFMGHPARDHTLAQKLLILVNGDQRVALIVDDIECLEEADEVLPLPPMHSKHAQWAVELSSILLGQVHHGDELVMLLKAELLFDVAKDWPAQGAPTASFGVTGEGDAAEIFLARMHRLAAPLATHDAQGPLQFAIVNTGERLYAIHLDRIVAFTSLRQYAVLPGCPACIVGCMNLRGEILSIVDIGTLAGSAPSPRHDSVVVLKHQGQTWACLIESVERLVTASEAQVVPMHDNEDLHPVAKHLLRDGDTVTTILNLEAVVALCGAQPKAHTHP